MAKTAIEWATDSWNPVTGCSKVSVGCRNCYAEKMAKRLAAMGRPEYQGTVDGNGRWTGEIQLVEDRLGDPYRWKKPRRVFVNSMSDLFHPRVPFDFILRVWLVMVENNQHEFLILTKRPERMREFVTRWLKGAWPLVTLTRPEWPASNIWLGVSVENQETAEQRIPILAETLAAVRFVSCEPLLGPVNLFEYIYKGPRERWWVIAGGESGSGSRPMRPEWVRKLRGDCSASGVPFFFKQWGDCKHGNLEEWRLAGYDGNAKKGGNTLDGRTWEEYPGGS